MLSVVNKPSNPNRTTASNTTKWVKDEYLHQLGSALNNLSSIPEKDIRTTNKSIDDYKNASNLEIISEIIATWNLTQYNVLSGIKNVLELNDRILHITEGRNKLIGQCMKRLNYLEHIIFLKETNEINIKPNDRINNIANSRMEKNKIKSTFEPIPTQQTIQNIDTNLSEINIAKIETQTQSHLTIQNMETLPKSTKSELVSIESAQSNCATSLPNDIDHMDMKAKKNENNPKLINRKSNISKIEPQTQSHLTIQNMDILPKPTKSELVSIEMAQSNCATLLPNSIDHMNINANKNEKNPKLINKKSNIAKTKRKLNPIKNNRKRNRNLNHRKKKKYKNKTKHKKRQQKIKPMKRIWNTEAIPKDALSNAEFFAQPIHEIDLAEADRRMAIH